MNARILLASFVAVFSMSACSDKLLLPGPEPELDACARPGACEVRGVDLVIEEVRLAFPVSQLRDSETGLPWVQQYDSVPVYYRVRNRGDQTSNAASGWMMSCDFCSGIRGTGTPIPTLEPGAVDSGIAMVPATQGFFVTSTPVLDLDLGAAVVDEPFYRNNRRVATDSYLTVAPDVRGTLELLSPEVRIGSPLRMVVRLRNHARHAILREDSLGFCFRRSFDYGLDSCRRAFGLRSVPQLGPGEQWQDTIDVQLTQQNYLYERHNAIPVRLDACLGARTSYATQPCAAGLDIVLRPDLESACAVRPLTVGVRVTDVFRDFAACYIYLAQFEAYAFDARAGRTYQVHVMSDAVGEIEVGIWNRDGEMLGTGGNRTARAAITADGRYYVVLRRASFDTPAFELVVDEVI